MRRLRCSLSCLSFILLTAASTHAAPIAITNAGFEGPVAGGDNGFSNEVIAGWVVESPASAFRAGVYDPPAGEIIASEGVQVAYLGPFGQQASPISQVLGEALAPSTVYTLRVDVGRRAGSPDAGFGMELLAGSDVLATGIDLFDLPVGTMTTATLVYSSPANLGALGGLLAIRLFNPPGVGQTNYDNVRLDAVTTTVAAPEPGSLMLMGTGIIGLLARTRRRQSRLLSLGSAV